VSAISLNSHSQSKQRDSLLMPSNQPVYFCDIDLVPQTAQLYALDGKAMNAFLKTDSLNPRCFYVLPHDERIVLTYRIFSHSLSKPYFHKDKNVLLHTDSLITDSLYIQPYVFTIPDENSREKVDVNGSLSRSVSVGNRQDMVMNSEMNLQIDGKLTDRIYVKGAISDNNVPIQPEGNTQSLQEFDKVYVKLYDEQDNQLVMGDYELTQRDDGFLQYYKKLKGASVLGNVKLDDTAKLSASVSAAVSKGRFCNQYIQAVEGNNGPYRLTGCNGELYVSLIAGSEKVYLDGLLLKRGFNEDYTINYNTAEISFTYKYLISAQNRIRVEFEYTDQNYARFFLANTTEVKLKKSRFKLNLYSEGDNKNQPLNANLTDVQKDILAGAGDMPAYVESWQYDSVYDADLVYYKKLDTIVAGSVFNDVLVYSAHKNDSLFRVTFSYVGEGKGAYVIDSSMANGRVFRWQPLDAFGNLQGNYSPLRVLPAAKLKQVVDFSGSFALTNSTDFLFDMAVSNNDDNTFSDYGSSDDVGYAVMAGIVQRIEIDSFRKLELDASWRFVQEHFEAVEDYNSSEYARDWNSSGFSADEHLLACGADYYFRQGKAGAGVEALRKGKAFSAERFLLAADYHLAKLGHRFTGSYMQSEMAHSSSDFLRAKNVFEYPIYSQVLGYSVDMERNIQKDSLVEISRASEEYLQQEVFLHSLDTARFLYKISFTDRTDKRASEEGAKMLDDIYSRTFSANCRKKRGRHNVSLSANYRQKWYAQQMGLEREREENLNGRLSQSWRNKKGGFSVSYFYELGASLERVISYQYIKVEEGQGTYMWNSGTDYNDNGIPELNEFELPLFQSQANYIRLTVPTNDYNKLVLSRFNTSVNVDLYPILPKAGSAFLKRLSTVSAADFQQKTKGLSLAESLLPFDQAVADSAVFSQSEMLRNMFYFNKRGRVFSCNVLTYYNKSKIQTVNGAEMRNKLENRLMWKVAFASKLFWRTDIARVLEKNVSEAGFMSERDYDLAIWEFLPSLEWQPGNVWRQTCGYVYKQKKDRFSNQLSEKQSVWLESKFSMASKMQLTGRIELSNMRFDGNSASALAYTMLEGLQPGKNYTWRINLNRQLYDMLYLQLVYEGQSSPAHKPLHMGQVVLKAIL